MKTTKTIRYQRPALQLEYDAAKLDETGCCRFVPVHITLSGIVNQEATLQVDLRRERTIGGDDHSAYNAAPKFYHILAGQGDTWQLCTEMLARQNRDETGTITVTMESYSGTELSKAEYLLIAGAGSITTKCDPRGFVSVKIYDHILTDEERAAPVQQTMPTAEQPTLLEG
jgi:hypothetical protein